MLGSASCVAPVLLFQVLVMTPVGLTVLAGSAGRAEGVRQVLRQPVRMPIVHGCVLGLLFAALGLELPAPSSSRSSWWPRSRSRLASSPTG